MITFALVVSALALAAVLAVHLPPRATRRERLDADIEDLEEHRTTLRIELDDTESRLAALYAERDGRRKPAP